VLAADLVRRGARRHGARTAIVVGDTRLSFRDVDEQSNRFANVFAGLGLGRGRRVGLLLNNEVWSVPVDFACLKAGVARVPLNSRLSAAEQARMLTETGVDLLVHGADLAERAHELAAELDGLRLAGLCPAQRAGDIDLVAAAEDASPADPMVPLRPDDVMVVLYTSGTTGTLKAAQHTQASYAAITANILANLLSPGRDDAMLHAASLIHASGTFLLPYWVRGGCAVVLPGFEPQSYVDAIARHRVTAINLVPTMLGMLFTSGVLDSADLSTVESIVYGASPMPRPLLLEGLDRLGPRFMQYYGQTEAPLCQTLLDKDDHAEGGDLLGSCGQPAVDADILIADGDGNPVAQGEIGEIRVRAPFTMAGYHNAPDLNRETITEDGWVRTRDMARADERGYLYLVDRVSDMIITGGYNVYPREVEDALLTHPAVAECAVVGAPDPTWVEAVTAFVVFRPGATASEAELRQVVRGRLAGYKVPKQVRVVQAIPKSAVGKIMRRMLRDPLWSDQ
jgi:acyl-CoA synthetase (AMP-forming)/AMP-acid ligase II